jgi:NADH:ubiquinone oxidoreductase subunit 5 (subunit L)/multisubunit Na+/H+ antiporter MnhA subunit
MSLAPLFTKVATEEHHFGTSEYVSCCYWWISGIGNCLYKIHQNLVPEEDEKITGFAKVLYNKYYVDEIYDSIFVKSINGLSKFFRDVETTLSSLVFGLGKVTNEIGFQGKKITKKRKWFCFCFRHLCHHNLFIFSSIILYYECISNINYTFSWRICNLYFWR